MTTIGIALGAAIAIGLSAIATAMTQGKIGSAGMGLVAERPEQSTFALICIAIPETMVILGFVIAVMILMLAK